MKRARKPILALVPSGWEAAKLVGSEKLGVVVARALRTLIVMEMRPKR
jgi:hypothetical protein